MNELRRRLEAEFLRTCRLRGPEWIESVIRPLQLPGRIVSVHDIPLPALAAIVHLFGQKLAPAPGVRLV